MDCLKLVYLILCVIHLSYSWTLLNPKSLNQDKRGKNPHRQVESLPNIIENDDNLDPFEMEGEGGGGQSTTTISIVFDLEESGLDRKLLGLPGWEYLTVTMVVIVATVIGGSVAIVCKKCGAGLFGRGSKKEND